MNPTEAFVMEALERGDVVLIITVEGGCVTDVQANGMEVPYEVVDYDMKEVGE